MFLIRIQSAGKNDRTWGDESDATENRRMYG